ncbi:hypothetical protein OIE71_34720 (plasmid) [Streptomyces sp. NBC_01725]|uniref:hypothetical protein n=1 Tax=Streptomyces sp. NBC_01725 TaxID=2975923 RepID=UPI002E2DEF04|nr:hypothetical protein [Streptomyces sp. NBC_01725]
MTRRERPVVPATSPVGQRQPLTPHVEPIITGTSPGNDQDTGTPQSQTPVLTDSVSPEVPESVIPEQPGERPERGEGPKWRGLERKEARLHDDQVLDLALLRKKISKQRKDRSEIITDNTLIRIAVDLLFAHQDKLRGDNESELLRSVLPRKTSRKAPSSGTSGVRE